MIRWDKKRELFDCLAQYVEQKAVMIEMKSSKYGEIKNLTFVLSSKVWCLAPSPSVQEGESEVAESSIYIRIYKFDKYYDFILCNIFVLYLL